ncbi:DUF1631 domain-containing protein [Chitinibacter bivalviorum]|uniref:DUF1631 domain-containing protein n=1 Tax=Chitinibacter bivalviorum TaxID=2739434 RepID=A0A7H9BG53_9NEIS|nr:DUF1631 family protein [Chitinibacter bivalviorum]QLG87690.1 DUF1631 domain-containing protein [Chitinibacter bivalviorum]
MSQPIPKPALSSHKTLVKQDPMLLACRDLAIKMLTESLEGFFARLEETYFELADKTFDRKQREDYFAARIETHNKKAILAAQFQQYFTAAFDKSAQNAASESDKKFYFVNADPDQLSLVANDEYEESITTDKVIKSIKSRGGEELNQLEMRFARLLSKDNQAGDTANPMSPEAICDAFLKACKQLETGVDARLVAMQAFEAELSSQVADVYHRVNQYLISKNVQPLVRRQNPSAKPAAAAPSPENNQAQQAASKGQELGAYLNQLATGDGVNHDSAAPTQEHAPGWLAFLDMLQRKAPASDELSDEEGNPLTHNLLGALRDSGWAKQLPQLDAMTLELVAMLFEHMFDDPRLSPSIKSLIGRLQIPLLKVAMIDASFFAKKHHPARHFLDELALTALDDQELERGMPRYDALAEIVNNLLRRFEDDISVFDDALHALAQLNQQQEDTAVQALAGELNQLASIEMAELAAVTTEQLIEQRLVDESIPIVIAAFLRETWQMALRQSYGSQGEAEPLFVQRLQAMDDLLWSVAPKSGADERFKMVNMLPGMLKTLEEGAKSVGVSHAQAQGFFSELVQCHAAAIRNGLKLGNPAPTAPVVEAKVAPAEVESAPVVAFELDLDQAIDAEEEEESIAASIFPLRGEWVDWLNDQGDVVRLRLSWISPQETRYLFTNRNVKGQAFLKAEVEEALLSGRMTRLILEGSLFDRAIQNVMSELN